MLSIVFNYRLPRGNPSEKHLLNRSSKQLRIDCPLRKVNADALRSKDRSKGEARLLFWREIWLRTNRKSVAVESNTWRSGTCRCYHYELKRKLVHDPLWRNKKIFAVRGERKSVARAERTLKGLEPAEEARGQGFEP